MCNISSLGMKTPFDSTNYILNTSKQVSNNKTMNMGVKRIKNIQETQVKWYIKSNKENALNQKFIKVQHSYIKRTRNWWNPIRTVRTIKTIQVKLRMVNTTFGTRRDHLST